MNRSGSTACAENQQPHAVYRAMVIGLSCLVFLLPTGACSRDQAAGTVTNGTARRPNFLLYVTDTLRADSLGCYGNPTVETPTLDALAAKGVLFERAMAPSSWTRASMASILTGLYPTAHHTAERLAQMPDVPRLTELLRRNGYRTASFTTNPNTAAFWGFRPSFDFFEQFGEWEDKTRVASKELKVPSDELHAAIAQWLDSHADDKPFFVVALAIDPHAPYDPAAEFDRYGDPGYRGPIRPGIGPRGMNREDLRPADKARLRSLYDAEVAYNDHTLGQLLEHLQSSGRADNTIVVCTSDHGEEFWEHGTRGHGKALYVESVHVPLIWYDPTRADGGVRVARPVSTVDIIPTMLAEAGLSVPDWAQGRPLFDDLPEPRAVYSELSLDGHTIWAVYLHPWHLIWNEELGQEALFNMDDDPAQRHNVVTAHPKERTRLRDLLDDHLHASRKLGDDISSGRVLRSQDEIPQSMSRQLRGLGYAGDDEEDARETEPLQTEPNPADGGASSSPETPAESQVVADPPNENAVDPSPPSDQPLDRSHGLG
ncbi:MAG: sulfatase [Planctomycetes bacterium]|nr:sulfatase [Planctomycetota bacterium]